MDTSKISNVLIFKDGFYWLTMVRGERLDGKDKIYGIIPDSWGLNNGFEFASDAYAYLASLEEKHNTITLDVKEEVYDGEI